LKVERIEWKALWGVFSEQGKPMFVNKSVDFRLQVEKRLI